MVTRPFARYNEISPHHDALIAELTALMASHRVLSSDLEMESYSYDASMERGRPSAVVFPETAQEVAAITSLCRRLGVPYIPRGSGTNLSGGSTAPHGGIICQLSRLDRVLSYSPDQRRAVVEPFVYNDRINELAAPDRLHFAPDPSSYKVSTLGGNAAENSGGPHALKYGVTFQHVLGVELVTPDAQVIRLGGLALERTGPDLLALLVGSEGTLGTITEVLVRLTPVPEHRVTLLAIFDDERDAGRAVSAVIASGIIPSTLELMDRETITAVERVLPAGYPPDADAVLLIEVDGVREAVVEEAQTAEERCRECRARSVQLTSDPLERDRLWHGRRSSYAALARSATGMMVCDAVVPRDLLPEALDRIREIVDRYGIVMADTFHAGDGNVHPKLLFDADALEEFQAVLQASTEIMRACVELGGAITGEHGVGTEKIHAMPWSLDAATLRLNRAVKLVFDGRELSNPGKIIRACDAPTAPPLVPRVRDLRSALEEACAGAVRVGRAEDAVDGHVPEFVCEPPTPDGLSAALVACSSSEAPVVVVGGRTAEGWGPPLRELAVLISTHGMTAVRELRAQNLTATFEAGCTWDFMAATVAQESLALRFDPPCPAQATLGGIIATAATGPGRFGHGPLRDSVLGVSTALTTGEQASFGGRVMKNVAGYDLTHLMLGARGALAAVAAATLRLVPLPRSHVTVQMRADSLARAFEAALQLYRTVLEPQALRVADAGLPMLSVGFAGLPAATRRLSEDAARCLQAYGDVETLEGPVAPGDNPASSDLLVELAVAPTLEAQALALAEEHLGARLVSADVGTGYILVAPVETTADALHALHGDLAALGGWVLDLKGPTSLRAEYYSALPSDTRLRGLNQAFDPAGVLAPGRLP